MHTRPRCWVVWCCSASTRSRPQWRGPNRDGNAAKFAAPKDWPKELTKKWKVTIGDGVVSPALVGDNRIFVKDRTTLALWTVE